MNPTRTAISALKPRLPGTERARIEAVNLQRSLATLTKRVVSADPQPIVVIFNVTAFHAIGEAGNPKTVYTMKLQPNDSVVQTDSATLVVAKSGPLNFQFDIQDNGAVGDFVPLTTAFALNVANSPGGTHIPPDDNFPPELVTRFVEHQYFTDQVAGEKDRYDFQVVIMQLSTRKLGILDPCILHQPT